MNVQRRGGFSKKHPCSPQGISERGAKGSKTKPAAALAAGQEHHSEGRAPKPYRITLMRLLTVRAQSRIESWYTPAGRLLMSTLREAFTAAPSATSAT